MAAEPSHLKALERFAERAYRRPLSNAENADLIAFYHQLRTRDGLSHEDAIRDTLASVLLSPHFAYRVDTAGGARGVRPLSDHALARPRPEYFPSGRACRTTNLFSHAAAGDLHEPTVLRAQVSRMRRDDKIRGLATEFAGNWLDYRRFEEHNGVDRERFPQFSNELRQALFEEPVRFIVDMVRENRSVLEGLYGDYTFVNPVLAEHYGIAIPKVGRDEWLRVSDVQKVGRGGLLPMAVFLTASSPGLRTSPVKRGYWVVRRMLGERIPARRRRKCPSYRKTEASTRGAFAAAASGAAPGECELCGVSSAVRLDRPGLRGLQARSASADKRDLSAGRSGGRAGDVSRRQPGGWHRRPAPLSFGEAAGRLC